MIPISNDATKESVGTGNRVECDAVTPKEKRLHLPKCELRKQSKYGVYNHNTKEIYHERGKFNACGNYKRS